MNEPFYRDLESALSKKVVFIGDSIVDGGGYIENLEAYFACFPPKRKPVLINLGLSSETASGLSEPDHPFPRPCIHSRLERALAMSQPDWVVFGYGLNDGIYHPFSDDRLAVYQEGMRCVLAAIRQAGAKAIVLTPTPFDWLSHDAATSPQTEADQPYGYRRPYPEYDAEVARRYRDWILTEFAVVCDESIDLYGPLREWIDVRRQEDAGFRYGDGLHPDAEGHWLIARILLERLYRINLTRQPACLKDSPVATLARRRQRLMHAAWKEAVGHEHPVKSEALPLQLAEQEAALLDREIAQAVQSSESAATARDVLIGEWHGCRRVDSLVGGREAIVVEPREPAAGRPWVWRAEFFDSFAVVDQAMLERGWHIVYYRLSNLYGSDEAVGWMSMFHDHVVDAYRLAPKGVLFGFSRGGLYSLHYALAHPEDVAALYLDAPVLDIESWPGGRYSAPRYVTQWRECRGSYGWPDRPPVPYREQLVAHAQKLAELAIPTIVVAGDADEAVPLTENAGILAATLGQRDHGPFRMIVKPGVGHHPHSLDDPTPIVAFLLEHTQVDA